jgi:RNA polymerase sigma factor (sigma-70 family)
LASHYPYDCEFEAWACVVTQHVCYHYMEREHGSNAIDTIDLSKIEEWLESPGDELEEGSLNADVIRKDQLLGAIGQLSEARKAVIFLHYFEGQSLAQIAADLKLPNNTIYKRHFDALKQLRKILGSNWYIDE